ncbi:MAG: glycosyltransferase family 92 protein [Methanosphaera sp.]|nr:glycosyltransferase family 92 protein [Methanosphaera sp.]
MREIIKKYFKGYVEKYGFICYSYSIIFLQNVNKIKSKKIKSIVLFLCIPYILLKWFVAVLYEKTIGTVLTIIRKRHEKNLEFENELSIVAILKNEAPYICEWIEYHLLVGVQKFYLYDNESNDGLKTLIQKYIDNGIVEYTFFPGKSRQLDAYNDAINKHKCKTRYMCFIDADEFIQPLNQFNSIMQCINDVLNNVTNAVGIGISWQHFGSSGRTVMPDGLVIESYLYHAKNECWQNRHIKTICNPRFVKYYVSPHFPIYYLGSWNVTEDGRRLRLWHTSGICYSKIRCNHYFCKSKQESIKKWNRGLADRNEKYDWSKFNEYDLNDVYDDTMLKYAKIIKEKLNMEVESL